MRRVRVDPDLALLQEFLKGRQAAFEELVHKYQRPVLHIIQRMLGSPRDAEDVGQEVFLRVARAAPSFKGECKVFTWVYRITVNLCLTAREKQARTATEPLEVEGPEGELRERPLPDPEGSAEETAARQETARQIREAVLSLPADQRAVAILRKYHDLPYEEIADLLEISVPSVKSRLHRAKIALQERLGKMLQ